MPQPSSPQHHRRARCPAIPSAVAPQTVERTSPGEGLLGFGWIDGGSDGRLHLGSQSAPPEALLGTGRMEGAQSVTNGVYGSCVSASSRSAFAAGWSGRNFWIVSAISESLSAGK